MVRFSVRNSYTYYRPNKLPLLRATWCETNTDLNPKTDLTLKLTLILTLTLTVTLTDTGGRS